MAKQKAGVKNTRQTKRLSKPRKGKKADGYGFPPASVTDPLWRNYLRICKKEFHCYRDSPIVEARSQLYTAYWPWVIKTATILSQKRKISSEKLEKILSNIAVDFHATIVRYDHRPETTFRTYATNLIVRKLRIPTERAKIHQQSFSNADGVFRLLECRQIDGDALPLDQIIEKEIAMTRKCLIRMALGHLPIREKKIIELRFWAGWTLEKTGASLQISKERVRQVESSALAKLAKILHKKLDKLEIPA